MLEAKDVTVHLNGRPIVHGADLRVPPGRITVVIGPNGSGKTTLFRALAGEIAYGGSISLDGAEIRVMRPRHIAARRAVLPQASVLPFPFTVREVVAMGVRGGDSGVPFHLLSALPEQALERVDLGGFAGRFYSELSGGEQQRVQLARVLCQVWTPVIEGQPRYLLLDEPVSSLDVKHQVAVMEIAREFAARGGGVLAVLHDLNLVAVYADNIHAMKRGRVSASGTPQEVLTERQLHEIFDFLLCVRYDPDVQIPSILPRSTRGPK